MNWKIKESTLKNLPILYPELEKVDISSWTYQDLYTYSDARLKESNFFTEEEKIALQKKNITLDDAKIILKDYPSVKAILNLDDKVIKEYLTCYYNDKKCYAQTMNAIYTIYMNEGLEKFNGTREINLESSSKNSLSTLVTNYTWVSVPGYDYQKDKFATITRTHVGDNNITASIGAQALWNVIYQPGNGNNIRSNYSAANLWGTKSGSRGFAHEGIDFNAKDTRGYEVKDAPIYAVLDTYNPGAPIPYATVRRKGNDSYGIFMYTIYNTDYIYTVTNMHTENQTSESKLYRRSFVANEGEKGAPGQQHLHFSVKIGDDTSLDVYDDYLTSDNPYIFAMHHTSMNYIEWE